MPHLLITAMHIDWIGIGAMIGAVCVVVLTVINYQFLITVKKYAIAASEQAAVALVAAQLASDHASTAKQTLDQVEHEIETTQVVRKETAIETLESVARNARSWIPQLYGEYTGGRPRILPDGWEDVLSFIAVQMPSRREDLRIFQAQIASTEESLNAYMRQSLKSRATIPQIATALGNHLEQMASSAELLAKNFQLLGSIHPSNFDFERQSA